MSDELSDRFAGFYRADADPWSYETSSYEADKYRATLAALPDRPIRRALEMGCSIGVFTEMLAERCGELVAADFSAFAVKQTRKRLAGRRSVQIERRDLRDSIPSGPFDLAGVQSGREHREMVGDDLKTMVSGALYRVPTSSRFSMRSKPSSTRTGRSSPSTGAATTRRIRSMPSASRRSSTVAAACAGSTARRQRATGSVAGSDRVDAGSRSAADHAEHLGNRRDPLTHLVEAVVPHPEHSVGGRGGCDLPTRCPAQDQ